MATALALPPGSPHPAVCAACLCPAGAGLRPWSQSVVATIDSGKTGAIDNLPLQPSEWVVIERFIARTCRTQTAPYWAQFNVKHGTQTLVDLADTQAFGDRGTLGDQVPPTPILVRASDILTCGIQFSGSEAANAIDVVMTAIGWQGNEASCRRRYNAICPPGTVPYVTTKSTAIAVAANPVADTYVASVAFAVAREAFATPYSLSLDADTKALVSMSAQNRQLLIAADMAALGPGGNTHVMANAPIMLAAQEGVPLSYAFDAQANATVALATFAGWQAANGGSC